MKEEFKKEFGVDLEKYMYFDFNRFLLDHGIKHQELPWYKANEVLEKKLGKKGYDILKSLMEVRYD